MRCYVISFMHCWKTRYIRKYSVTIRLIGCLNNITYGLQYAAVKGLNEIFVGSIPPIKGQVAFFYCKTDGCNRRLYIDTEHIFKKDLTHFKYNRICEIGNSTDSFALQRCPNAKLHALCATFLFERSTSEQPLIQKNCITAMQFLDISGNLWELFSVVLVY